MADRRVEPRPTPGRSRISGATPLALLLVIAACASETTPTPAADPAPWDEPVPGAVAVTEWKDNGQPAGPFGPSGPGWGSPDELVTSMATALAAAGDIRTTAKVVEQRPTGTVVGWVRMQVADDVDEPVLAGDMRVEMRDDGGSWVVVRVEARDHCARDLIDGDCR